MAFTFKSRNVVEGLIDVLDEKPWMVSPKIGVRPTTEATSSYICQTPTEGIAGRVGSQCGEAICTMKNITNDGVLEDARNCETEEVMTVKVFNPFSSPVGGNRIITAKRVFGRIIVDAEDCT